MLTHDSHLTPYLEKYIRKLMGNTEIEDSLDRLDKLTQEEARMASAELLKVTHSVDDRVKSVEGDVQDVHSNVLDVSNKVEGVDSRVQGVDDKVQGVDNRVQCVDNRVQGVDNTLQGISSEVRGVDHKLDQVNRSLSLKHSLSGAFTQLYREPAQGQSFTMAFAPGSVNQS